MRPVPLPHSTARYGKLRFKGKADDVLAQLRAVIAREAGTRLPQIGEPFSIHPEVEARTNSTNKENH